MRRNFIFFINPISGTKNKSALRPIIEKRFAGEEASLTFLETNKEGDYLFLPALIISKSITDIIICGGDGTVNQVAACLLKSDVNVGIIPMGSGNGLALAAGISRNISKALETIIHGVPSPIDCFYINKKFSCMLCGIGFDAQVAHAFAKQTRRGLATYALQTLKKFFTASPFPLTIEVNNSSIKTETFFISIANSNQFGNNVTIAPRASLSDGLLDIVIVNKMGKLNMLYSLMKQVFAGKLNLVSDADLDKKGILYLQTKKLQIHNPSMAPLHIDGEPAETSDVFEIEIMENAFRLLQPASRT